MPAEIVRVKDPVSGAEYDVPKSRLSVCPDLQVIDKPTGQRAKPNMPLGTPLPGTKADRKRSAAKNTAPETPAADENDGQSVATEREN